MADLNENMQIHTTAGIRHPNDNLSPAQLRALMNRSRGGDIVPDWRTTTFCCSIIGITALICFIACALCCH